MNVSKNVYDEAELAMISCDAGDEMDRRSEILT
jgi:hypothetical protein